MICCTTCNVAKHCRKYAFRSLVWEEFTVMQSAPVLKQDEIQSLILHLRGQQVLLDSDLALLYGVETKVLNQAVKRNLTRFPEHFRFQVSFEEVRNLRSQFVTSNFGHQGGRRYAPYVFTEQGVAMLAAVLKSETAVLISIQIMDAFVAMRKYLVSHAAIFQRLTLVERKQMETDQQFDRIFKALEKGYDPHEQGIFYEGAVFEARLFAERLVSRAKQELILFDNYVDGTTLGIFARKEKQVRLHLYTKRSTTLLEQQLAAFIAQYGAVDLHVFTGAHDRFLIIDRQECYHFGASLKDLGKKLFAFSRMDSFVADLLRAVHP